MNVIIDSLNRNTTITNYNQRGTITSVPLESKYIKKILLLKMFNKSIILKLGFLVATSITVTY